MTYINIIVQSIKWSTIIISYIISYTILNILPFHNIDQRFYLSHACCLDVFVMPNLKTYRARLENITLITGDISLLMDT